MQCSLPRPLEAAQNCVKQGMTFMAAASLVFAGPALAGLNALEAAAGGEFNIGSARQYGEADLKGQDFSKQAGGMWLAGCLALAISLPQG